MSEDLIQGKLYTALTSEMLNNEVNKALNLPIKKVLEKIEKHYELSIKNFANPPIEGEITTESLLKAGIKRVIQGNTEWLEQNGRRISSRVKWDCTMIWSNIYKTE